MGAPRQIRLPLDVDDPGPPHGGGGRDAGRLPEHVVAQRINGKPVDLAHDLAVNIDHEGPPVDHLLDMLLH